MSLEGMYRNLRSEYFNRRPYPRRKLRKLDISRRMEEKKVVAEAEAPKKVVRDPHWCARCDIGYLCGKR